MVDFATRAHNHNYRMDPIIRSLLDIDFYKLLMAQFIWERYPLHQVEFEVKNRTKSFSLDRDINAHELSEQLNNVRSLRFTNQELIWLQGATFYGQERIFKPGFISFLRTLQIPRFNITYEGDRHYENPEMIISFPGTWMEATFWEIYALSIISELKTRSALAALDKFELDILYSNAKSKLWNNLTSIRDAGVQNVSDMGTRRRHSFLWQEWAVEAAASVLGRGFLGTSNAYLAMKLDLEAIGTNAHELPMTLAAIKASQGGTDEEIRQTQYDVLKGWQNQYSGNLLVALPDTFGTTQFLKDAPQWVSNWRGFRPDSKAPDAATEELVAWWNKMGVDPKEKLVLYSDGLDAPEIIRIWDKWKDTVKVGFGWGTMLTNDFKGCHPRGHKSLDPISLVCKVKKADGHAAVKLSDNYEKATGDSAEVERYRGIFGHEGMANAPVLV